MSVLPTYHEKRVSEVRNVAIDFQGKLDTSELLTGTPTVTEVDTTDLTLASKVVSTAELTIRGTTVAIGEAVQFRVSGGVAGGEYTIRISVTTTASPAQTLVDEVILKVIAD